MGKIFDNEWIFEDFDAHPSFRTKRMFGGLAIYLFEKQVFLIVEPTKSGRWDWHGVLICTDLENQKSLRKEFPDLKPHQFLKKWLYIESSHKNFEPTIQRVTERVLENDNRIGIFAKTRQTNLKKKPKTTTTYTHIRKKLKGLASKKISAQSQRFFKTEKGQYGYGDIFLGIRVPVLRKIAKDCLNLSLPDTKKLIKSKYHEERLVGLLTLVNKYSLAKTDPDKEKLYKIYISSFKYINNWDLVDVTCPQIIGKHLMDKDRKVLYSWAKSEHLWTKRIAIITNWWFIRNKDLREVFKISKILLKDEHDLIHKAVGWMLREAGKKDLVKLEAFLKKYYKKMPRTMLRYAIEKFPEAKRQKYLKGKI